MLLLQKAFSRFAVVSVVGYPANGGILRERNVQIGDVLRLECVFEI